MTQKIRRTKRGDRLSSAHYNQVVDGANLALQVLGPPRSTRLARAQSNDIELDAEGDGVVPTTDTVTYTEIDRTTSTVDVDGVAIERFDSVRLRSAVDNSILEMVFDND